MSLVKCKECGKEYSTDAKACPNCGKRRTTSPTKIIAVFFALIFVAGIYESNKAKDTESERRAVLTEKQRAAEDAEKAKENRLNSARVACKLVLEKSLNDPDSAKLEKTFNWYAEERKDGTVLVQPAGRAKNSFGAYIYGVWGCVAKPQGDNFRIMSLKQIRP